MGNIQDVQDPSCSGLCGGRLARVMRNVVSVNDVVIPVSLTRLKGRALESECAFPST